LGTKEEPREASAQEVAAMRLEMAATLVRQGDYEKALPYLKDLRIRFPKNARVHLLLGIVLREKGMHKPAHKEISMALKLSPKDPEALAAMGILLGLLKRYQEAEELHRQTVDLRSGEARYRNNLGFCLFLQKRYEDAEEEIREAIRLDPGMRRAYNNLGFIHGLQGHEDAAMQAFSQAGSRALALTNMGVVEELRGRPVSARHFYEKALKVQQGFKPALANLQAMDPQTVSPPKTKSPHSEGGSK